MTIGGVGLDQLFQYIQTAGVVGLLALAAKLYVDRRRLQIDAKAADASAQTEARRVDLDVDIHRDGLTIDLLQTARDELAELREQLARLRPADMHLRHFETALDHIDALLHAKDTEKWDSVARSARAFVTRMKRLSNARGTITNEIQRLDSAVSLSERGERGREK